MERKVSLPYFDVLLDGLRHKKPAFTTAFGRHVHWGYWGAPDKADGSLGDFALAAEQMCERVCAAGGVRDALHILDVGCGLGGTVANLNERLYRVELTGLNIDSRQLEWARQHVLPRSGNRIRFQQGDACDMPFEDASFDVVLALECVFHFPSRNRFLSEARRVLRPGGRLALSDFLPIDAAGPILSDAQKLVFGRYMKHVLGPADFTFTHERYLSAARAEGLSFVHEEDITRNTLPTYSILRQLTPEMGSHRRTARAGIGALEWLCRTRLVRYRILSFARPLDTHASAAERHEHGSPASVEG
jgi:SAM-dependent methyltransferase